MQNDILLKYFLKTDDLHKLDLVLEFILNHFRKHNATCSPNSCRYFIKVIRSCFCDNILCIILHNCSKLIRSIALKKFTDVFSIIAQL